MAETGRLAQVYVTKIYGKTGYLEKILQLRPPSTAPLFAGAQGAYRGQGSVRSVYFCNLTALL
jgi:hypothetical protein